MRTLRLVRVAAEAERLRLKRQLRRTIARVVMGVACAVFATAALCVAHVVVWLALVPHVSPLGAALILLGIDVVVAVVLGLVAASDRASAVESESRQIRQRALAELKTSFTLAILVRTAIRVLREVRRR